MFVEDERDPVAPDAVALGVGAGGVALARLPLKAGIGCMNIEILLEAALSLPGAALLEDVFVRAVALAPVG